MPDANQLTARGREMLEVMRELEASGMTVHEFADEHDLSESTLWHWRRRLRDVEPSVPDPLIDRKNHIIAAMKM